MDTVCDKKRVSDSISCPTQINQSCSSVSEEISYRPREDLTPSAGGRINAGKTCHRTSLFTSSEGRLLQPDFPGSEEVRRMETGDRSVQTESVHPISSLQNGNHRLSPSYSTEEQLGPFTGLERCIFSYCHPSQVQEVSPFQFMGRTYQFWALPFGLSPAPYVFPRVVKTEVKHCRQQGMRLHAYLDDWLQPSISQSLSFQQQDQLLQTVLSLGFVPNWDKSELIPSQTFCFLGARFDLEKV